MIALYAILFLLLALGIRVHWKGFVDDALARSQTDAVKGFFIGCVTVSHMSGYLTARGIDLGRLFTFINFTLIGQLMVVMFLFYSGYGVMRAIEAKGEAYVRAMPLKRILTTLVNFDVAVAAFFLLNVLFAREMTARQVLLSFLGWDSLHNSNWYIFDILLCYVFTWVSARFLSRKYVPVATTVLCLGLMGVLSTTKGTWWYDTLLAYPFGLFVGCHQDVLKTLARRFYWPLIVLVIVGLGTAYWLQLNGGVRNIQSILFAAFAVLASMKVAVKSAVLAWMGAHLFPIYIYQRIPMNAMEYWKGGVIVGEHPVVFVLVAVAVTGAIAALYRKWEVRFVV